MLNILFQANQQEPCYINYSFNKIVMKVLQMISDEEARAVQERGGPGKLDSAISGILA